MEPVALSRPATDHSGRRMPVIRASVGASGSADPHGGTVSSIAYVLCQSMIAKH